MFNFYRSILIVFILSCYSSYAHAVLEAVIVSAARTEQSALNIPASITVITQRDIELSGASHVVDVLRSLSGLLVEDTFGDGSRAVISMRGFSGSVANSNTLILIDGRRLNNTDISNPDLNSISLKDVERIEIIQGSAGVVYGDQAVGGVVNIITKKVKGKSGVIQASLGTYHAASLRGSFSDNLSDNLNFYISGEMRQSDNYRRQNNDIDYLSLFVKTDYRYSKGTVFAEYQLINEDLRTPGSLMAGDVAVDRRQTNFGFLDDFTNSETDVIRLGLKHKLKMNWSLEGEITLRDVEREIQQSFYGFAITTSSALKRKQTEITPRLIGYLPITNGDIQITTGIDYIKTDFDSEITASADDQIMLAEYMQVVFPFRQKIDITAGFRHAEVEDDITSALTNGKQSIDINVAEIGMSYEMSDQIKIFGRIDQNFRFAKVDELTYVSPGVQLKPQTGNSLEIGMQYTGDTVSYSAMAYHLALEDEIAFDPTATMPVGGGFAGANVNFDPTTHRGLTLNARYNMSPTVKVTGSYTFTVASFDSGVFAGNAISGVPENSASMAVNYQHTDALNINLDAVYVGSRYLDGDNSNVMSKLPNHTVLSANFMYRHKERKLNLKINNLTNRKYFETANSFGAIFPSPERNILLSAIWQFR